jgi:hypothetical protein
MSFKKYQLLSVEIPKRNRTCQYCEKKILVGEKCSTKFGNGSICKICMVENLMHVFGPDGFDILRGSVNDLSFLNDGFLADVWIHNEDKEI